MYVCMLCRDIYDHAAAYTATEATSTDQFVSLKPSPRQYVFCSTTPDLHASHLSQTLNAQFYIWLYKYVAKFNENVTGGQGRRGDKSAVK